MKFELYTTILKYPRIIIAITILTLSSLIGSVSFAFIGPGSLTPGTGNGALQVDSNLNIGFGTNLATPTGDATNALFGRVFTIASTSDPGISLRNLGGGRNYTMYSRANGRFVIWDDFSSRPRFFIDANGFVGISGNSTSTYFFTPASALHVAGSIQSDAAFVGAVAPSSITGGAFQSSNYAFPSAVGVGTSTTSGLPTGGMYVAGNVGIGTVSPGAKLDVMGSDADNAVLARFYANTSSRGSFIIRNGTGSNPTTFIGTAGSNEHLAIGAVNTERIRIAPGGNVGIGSTSPNAPLEIGTQGSIQGANVNLILSGSGGYPGIQFWNASGVSRTIIRQDSTNDRLAIFTNTGTAAVPVLTEKITLLNSGNFGIGVAAPTAKLHIYGEGATDMIKMTANYATPQVWTQYVDSGGWYLKQDATFPFHVHSGGNVGIGTNTPGQKLTVAGVIESTTGGIKFPDGTTQVTAGGGIGNSVGWSRTGTNVFLSTSTDWVGIGTSTPTQALDVRGNLYVSGNITTGGTMTTNVGASNVSAGSFGTTAGKGNYRFEGAATTNDVLKIDATNERVGVGTASPGYKLDIAALSGSVEPTSLKISGGATNATQIRIGDNYTASVGTRYSGADSYLASNAYQNTLGADSWAKTASTYSSAMMSLGISSTLTSPAFQIKYSPANTATGGIASFFTSDLLTVLGNGNVGIGTTGPSDKLQVSGGSIWVPDDNSRVLVGDGSYGLAMIKKGSENGRIIFGSGSTFSIAKSSAANIQSTGIASQTFTSYFDIANNGNVGIGTAAPRDKLDVNGDIANYTASGNNFLGNKIVTNGVIQINGFKEVGQSSTITVTGGTLVSGGPTARNGYGAWDVTTFPQTMTISNRGWWTLGGISFVGGDVYGFQTNRLLPKSFLIEKSTDNISWTTLADVTNNTGNSYFLDGFSDSPYIRITVRAPQDTRTGSSIALLQIFETHNVGVGNGPFTVSHEGNAVFIGGNVGVGTTTPASALSVVGDIRATGNVIAGGTMTANVGAPNVSAGTFGTTAGKGNYTFEAAANTNNVLKVDATNERVGVGESGPTTALDVKKDVPAASGTSPILLVGNKSGNWSNYAMIETRNVPDGRAVRFGSYLGSSSYTQGGFAVVTGVDGDISSTPTTKFFVRHDGNVGIGTNTPGKLLELSSASAPTMRIRNTNYSPNKVFDFSILDSGGLYLVDKDNDKVALFSESSGVAIGSGYATGAYGPPANGMIVEGNIGVGTTTPAFKLDVAGVIRSNVANVGTINLGTDSFSSTYTTAQIIGQTSPNYTSSGKLSFKVLTWGVGSDYGPTEQMSINVTGPDTKAATIIMAPNGGKVGIGTSTAPTYMLDVAGTGSFANPVIVGSPTAVNHATTKSYVDSLVTGGATSGNLATLVVTGTTTLASTAGKVIIGGAGPSLKLDVTGQGQLTDTISATKYYDYNDPTYYVDPANTGTALKFNGAMQAEGTGVNYLMGQLGVGASNPGTHRFYVGNGTSYFNNTVSINGSLNMVASSSISMGNGNIGTVGKLTVQTIDPLYEIDGEKYATYASSIAGGVKEEYVGRGKLISNDEFRMTNDSEFKIQNSKFNNYTYVIDFSKIEKGSDLWVWYQAVDFDKKNVEALVTAYDSLAKIGYKIDGKKLIFFSDEETEFSFRLVGNRFDHMNWPTYSKDQNETPSFILKSK
ncbi:MAG: hypothetical protein LiPW41_372 [Parcubacteria group bacterium LiPW_41]|nr:MAG: hypothetical protein LiPW41_372 [Parcubacteria group bacterium LiPW_41]